jgi:hypothetical protein
MDKNTTPFVSLTQKVNEFISSLELNSLPLEKQLIKEIIKYFMKISDTTKKQTYVLKNRFSEIGLRNEIDRFQNEYLSISYYTLRVLYPAIVIKVQNKTQKISQEVLSDVKFCIGNLSEKELAYFKENTKDYDTTPYSNFNSFVGGDCWIENYDKLYSYVRSKVGKLSFMLKDDPSLDMEDCVQEIILGIIKVYNLDPKAFSNKKYVDMAIANQINSLLNYYTRGKRKRYCSEHDEKYEKIKTLKKKKCYEEAIALKNSIIDRPDYYSTLCHSEQILATLSIEEKYDDRILINQVLEKAKSKKVINDYCQILLDNNPDFDKWATKQDINTDCFTSLCRGAKRYINTKYNDINISNWPLYVRNNLGMSFN